MSIELINILKTVDKPKQRRCVDCKWEIPCDDAYCGLTCYGYFKDCDGDPNKCKGYEPKWYVRLMFWRPK